MDGPLQDFLYNVCFKKTGTMRSSVLQLRFVPIFCKEVLSVFNTFVFFFAVYEEN